MNSKLDELYFPDFEDTWEIIYSSFKEEGDLLLSPRKWYLKDTLIHSTTLRYFSTKVNSIYLWVNSDTLEVNYVHLKFD